MSNSTPPVWGRGNLSSTVMVLGEAPGELESRHQKPFVGRSGKELDKWFQSIGLVESSYFITNVVKCRPTFKNKNRPPHLDEVKSCSYWLAQQINFQQPEVIITLGSIATRTILEDQTLKISECHGRIIPHDTYLVFPLYHPATLLYHRNKYEPIYRQDFSRLFRLLKKFRVLRKTSIDTWL